MNKTLNELSKELQSQNADIKLATPLPYVDHMDLFKPTKGKTRFNPSKEQS